jgi:hypothetical protein
MERRTVQLLLAALGQMARARAGPAVTPGGSSILTMESLVGARTSARPRSRYRLTRRLLA